MHGVTFISKVWGTPSTTTGAAIDQALILRGSREFDPADDYADFVSEMVRRHNRLVQGTLEQERPHLQPQPRSPAPMPKCGNYCNIIGSLMKKPGAFARYRV